LIKDHDGNFQTVQKCTTFEDDLLVPVFENGRIVTEYTFEQIIQRAEISHKIEEFVS
jgi:hypothetical protein